MKKTIDPEPIIEELAARRLRTKGMECSLLGEVIDILRAAPDISVRWIPVEDHKPKDFVSVLGYMTNAGEFPSVRECYAVGRGFFFPALDEVNPVSHWMEMPEPPEVLK